MALTCGTCHLAFSSTPEFRGHYKEELHRINLKRKVRKLPPVTREEFQEKLDAIKAAEEPVKEKKKEAKAPVPKTEEELIAHKLKHAVKIGPLDSLFDSHKSTSIEANLEYMSRKFGFFVPDLEYLEKPAGLLEYLGEKIGMGNYCIWCEKGFRSLEAVRHHMLGSGHCKMLYDDNEGEYEEFYNWEVEDEDAEPSTSTELILSTGEGDGADNPFELSLTNGKVLGHRSLARYYKQKMKADDMRESVVISRMMAQYRSIGWKPTEAPSAKRARAKELARQKRDRLRMGIRNNKIKQHHFRSQLDF